MQEQRTLMLEELLSRAWEPVAAAVDDLFSLAEEENIGYTIFPKEGEKLEFRKLQCPKCLDCFSTSYAYKEHVQNCKSLAGWQSLIDWKRARVLQASTAHRRLMNTSNLLRNRAEEISRVTIKLRKQKRDCKAKAPEVICVISSCIEMLAQVLTYCEEREHICKNQAEAGYKKFGLGAHVHDSNASRTSVDAEPCLMCFDDDATELVNHENGQTSHIAVCHKCFAKLAQKMLDAKKVYCPKCRARISSFGIDKKTFKPVD
jgi:hypothetical protein